MKTETTKRRLTSSRESGAALVEYVLVAGIFILALAGSQFGLARSFSGFYERITESLDYRTKGRLVP